MNDRIQYSINSANLGDGHHFSAIDFPILTIVHGSGSDRGEGIIASDLVVVLSC